MKKYLLLAFVLYACGDISDTCVQSGNRQICYYAKEIGEGKAKEVGAFLLQHYGSDGLNMKINHHADIVIVQVEINTGLPAEKQQSFLSSMAQGLADNCFQGTKVRAVGVDDIDATTKGNIYAESK